MTVQSNLTRLLVSIGVAALLTACGGGGGSAGQTVEAPPTTAATLAQSSQEAQAAVVAAVAGGRIVVDQSAGLDSSFVLFGNPLAGGAAPINLASRVASTVREQPMAVDTVACADVFGNVGCSGSVRVDTNAPVDANTTTWPAGTYISMSFNALSGTLDGSLFAMNGTVRIDYLTPIDFGAATFTNAQIQVAMSGVSGSIDGVSFGPDSSVALLEFDGAGVGTVTVDGMRIAGLDGLLVTDDDNYQLLGSRSKCYETWGQRNSAKTTYVDTEFDNWVVTGARPQLGSRAVLEAGNASVMITVTSVSSTAVVYDVVMTIAGQTTSYTVTATYPSGSAEPSYSVIVAAT